MTSGVDTGALPARTVTYRSFDGGVTRTGVEVRPDRYRQLEALPASTPRISRGAGSSSAALSFGGDGVVEDCTPFDRVLEFDPETGLLTCEAGIDVGRLGHFLGGHGWYLAARPERSQSTVGGCVAVDAHGVDHHRHGSFSYHVRRLTIFHPAHGCQSVQAGDPLFDLTCGGLGLTGRIVTVTLQAVRLDPNPAQTVRQPVAALADVPASLGALRHADGVWTWHDLKARGERFGPGDVYATTFGHQATSRPASTARAALLRAGTAPWLTGAARVARRLRPARSSHQAASFRRSGRSGFHEYRMLLETDAFDDACDSLRATLGERRFRSQVAFASVSPFEGRSSYVRFDGSGLCVTVHFPRSKDSLALCDRLDAIAIRTGAIPCIASDSRLPRAVVEACYVGYDDFRLVLETYDPARLYRSEASGRLGF